MSNHRLINSATEPWSGPWLVYDGDCPLCTMVAQKIEIEKTTGRLALLNARQAENHPILVEIKRRQLDLDQGIVFVYNNVFYNGHDAMKIITRLGNRDRLINWLFAQIFRSHFGTIVIYAFFRFLRNALLFMRGKAQIQNLKP
jgi:predicted DCC family thiol-disulfide oxidoreductase YuxK